MFKDLMILSTKTVLAIVFMIFFSSCNENLSEEGNWNYLSFKSGAPEYVEVYINDGCITFFSDKEGFHSIKYSLTNTDEKFVANILVINDTTLYLPEKPFGVVLLKMKNEPTSMQNFFEKKDSVFLKYYYPRKFEYCKTLGIENIEYPISFLRKYIDKR